MSRSMTAAVKTALRQTVIRGAAQLIEMNFDTGPVRFWTGIGGFVWNAKTFDGVGKFGGISHIEETIETKSQAVQISISGIDPADISEAMTEDFMGRRLNGWLAFVDSDWALIDAPVQNLFHRMDQVEVIDGETTATVRVTLYPRLNDLFRPRVHRQTDADQQDRFPGDIFFNQKPRLVSREIEWGS